MTAVNRSTLYGYFLTGSRPTQQQFANLIDSCLNLVNGSAQEIIGDLTVSGNATVTGALDIGGIGVFRSDIAVSGDVTIGGTFAPAIVSAGMLNVAGQSNFNGMTITGTVSAQGALKVDGATTLASAKGITPALGSSSTDFATTAFCNPDSVLGTTGSRINSDGSIDKWGSATTSAGGTSAVVFASAFPNAVYQIIPAAVSPSNLAVVTYDTPTVTGFNISGWDAGGARGNVVASWMAKGK